MIPTDPTWQIKHSWRVSPSRKEISKVLSELKIMLAISAPVDLASKIYLAADELLRNSLEHGCLRIGKEKKAQLLELGTFDEFLSNSEENLKDDQKYWIELNLEIEKGELILKVKDSGDGYKLQAENEKSPDLTRLSNRGLEIVLGVSSKTIVEKNPTQTIVTFTLS